MRLMEILCSIVMLLMFTAAFEEVSYVTLRNEKKVLEMEKNVSADQFLVKGFYSICEKMNASYSSSEKEMQEENVIIDNWLEISNELENTCIVKIEKTEKGWKQYWFSDGNLVAVYYDKENHKTLENYCKNVR